MGPTILVMLASFLIGTVLTAWYVEWCPSEENAPLSMWATAYNVMTILAMLVGALATR